MRSAQFCGVYQVVPLTARKRRLRRRDRQDGHVDRGNGVGCPLRHLSFKALCSSHCLSSPYVSVFLPRPRANGDCAKDDQAVQVWCPHRDDLSLSWDSMEKPSSALSDHPSGFGHNLQFRRGLLSSKRCPHQQLGQKYRYDFRLLAPSSHVHTVSNFDLCHLVENEI